MGILPYSFSEPRFPPYRNWGAGQISHLRGISRGRQTEARGLPDPLASTVEIDGVRYLQLEKLIELKLASGMSNPGRLMDLADVQELIRALKLPKEFGEPLDAYVKDRFSGLWDAVAQDVHSSEPA